MCLKWAKAAKEARTGRLSEHQARKVVADIVESAGGKPPAYPTVADFFRGWLKEKSRSISERSIVRYAGVIEQWLKFLGDAEIRHLDHVQPEEVKAFVDAELSAGKSASTVNVALKQIRGAFEKARLEGKIPLNPAGAIDNLQERRTHRKPFNREQIEALYQVANDTWKGMILLGFSTGARIGDCAGMTWENVDLERGIISFIPDKARNDGEEEMVLVPIFPQLEDWFLSHFTGKKDAPIFPDLFPHARKTDGNTSKQFHAIMKKAEISRDFGGERTGKGRRVSRQTFHSMRSTFVSELANRNVTPEVRMKLAGHKNEGVHSIYTNINLGPLRDAVATIRPLRVVA